MATLLNSEEGTPLRLYYTLEPGQTANAEVISRASLAFVSGVRELAYVLDPSLKIQIGIEGHTEGSLWEDLLLFVGKVRGEYDSKPIRYNLALAALAWLLTPPAERLRDNWWEPILDQWMPEATKEEREAAVAAINLGESGNVAAREKQAFYREVGRDTAISGVGANIDRTIPTLLVKRERFPLYSGQAPTLESELDRTTVGPLRVIILSPVLEVSNRRWKFATAQGEFGASIKDKGFLERIVAGRTAVRMRGGVELDVQLETRERLVGGVWTIVERNVLHVDDIIEPAADRQGSMFPQDGDEH